KPCRTTPPLNSPERASRARRRRQARAKHLLIHDVSHCPELLGTNLPAAVRTAPLLDPDLGPDLDLGPRLLPPFRRFDRRRRRLRQKKKSPGSRRQRRESERLVERARAIVLGIDEDRKRRDGAGS